MAIVHAEWRPRLSNCALLGNSTYTDSSDPYHCKEGEKEEKKHTQIKSNTN